MQALEATFLNAGTWRPEGGPPCEGYSNLLSLVAGVEPAAAPSAGGDDSDVDSLVPSTKKERISVGYAND